MDKSSEIAPPYLKVLDIPDLWLEDVANDDTFLLIGSNKENIHHIYKVEVSNLTNWIDITPGSDRVFSGSLSSDDLEFLYPKENSGNERFDIYATNLQSTQTKLALKLDDTRVSSVKRTKDKKYVLIDGGTATNIGFWRFNTQTNEFKEIYLTKLWGEMGSLCPNKPLIIWSEIKQFGSSDSVIKIVNFESVEVLKTIDLGEGALLTPGSWSPDGSKVLFSVTLKDTAKIGIYELETGSITYSKASDAGLGIDYPHFEWITNDEIIFTAKVNYETKLYREKIGDETPQEIPFKNGFITKLIQGKKNKNKFYICWSNLSNPEQILELDLDTTETKVLITANPFEKELTFAKFTFLNYPTFDKKWEIPAFEIDPIKNNSETSPIIVLIHGGPEWEFSNSWETMASIIHLYSQAGFRVFCPNIRGSTGNGKEFQDVNIGDIGGDDLQDVLYAQKYLKTKYPQANIYLTGASYGGFMTFLVMTKHPGVFKAGAPVVGITDYSEMYRLGDQFFKGFTQHYLKGRPEEQNDLYADRSAINFVQQLQEPLYIVHRENDTRCPVLPIYTFVGKAVSLGKDVTLFVQQGAGHGSQKMEDLKQQYGGITRFFLRQEEKN